MNNIFKKFISIRIFKSRKLSNKKQTFFAKKLTFLLGSGMPVIESIKVISKQSKTKNDARIFNIIISDLSNGQTLASSLASFDGIFSNFTINIIKSGELCGNLNQNLNYLAEELKKKEVLKHKIMSALLYPFIVTLSTFGIALFLIVYIFPKIMPIFKSLNADLPTSTKIIIFLSEMIRNNGIYILMGIFILGLILGLVLKKYDKLKTQKEILLLKLPIIGIIIQNYNLANMCRTLGLLLKSGVSLGEATKIASDTSQNILYKKSLLEISGYTNRGKNISETICLQTHMFGDMLGQMISIGERSGNLPETFLYLSEFYENEFDDLTKNLSTSIEPFLMILMGLIVGFVAISVITPIYEITNTLNK